MNIYTLNLRNVKIEHAYVSLSTPNLATWHRCLGHANYQAVIDVI